MSKGRSKQRIHRIADPNMRYTIGLLKRLERRILAGQQIPFLIATIEPRNVPGMPEPVADPAVASRGMADHRLAPLRQKLLDHLVDIGVLKTQDAPKEPKKDDLEVDLG